jgi:hypothetical protein
MAELEFFLLAQSVAVDRGTNTLSLFHVIEELSAAGLPIVLPQLTAVSVWLLTQGEQGSDFQVSLRATKPDGAESRRFDHNFTATRHRQRMMMQLEGFPFDATGEWVFELLLNGEHKARHRVTIQPSDADRSGGVVAPVPVP